MTHELGRASGKIRKGLTLTITFGADGMRAEWNPDVPKRLTPAEVGRYREIRGRALDQAAAVLGAPVAVIEA